MSPLQSLREERVLSPLAFNQLLSWLDDGADSQGEAYLEMRRRLVAYFDRRNRLAADDLADEVLNRVARTLETDGFIATRPPARYCYVVARFVLLEDIRHERSGGRTGDTWAVDVGTIRYPRRAEPDEEATTTEQRLACLDRCLQELRADQRELVIEYYRDSKREKIERRQALARSLGITMNALAIRASRIRASLEACVTACQRGPK